MSEESNPILSGAMVSFETFMTQWEMLSKLEGKPHMKALIEPGLTKTYKYYDQMDRTKAYIIAMGTWTQSEVMSGWLISYLSVLNPVIWMSWIENKWGQPFIKRAVEIIKTTVGLANFIEK